MRKLLRRCNSSEGRRIPDNHLAKYNFTFMYINLLPQDFKGRLGNFLDLVHQHRLQTSRARISLSRQDHTLEWKASGRQSETDQEMMMSSDKTKEIY